MAHGICVVGVKLLHDDDFSGEATTLAVLVGAATSRADEQVDLPARHAGLRDV